MVYGALGFGNVSGRGFFRAVALAKGEARTYLQKPMREALNAFNAGFAAHLFGTLLVAAGLPAQLRGRCLLSCILVLAGVAVAHLPDLAASSFAH